jgi:hypothetical protein
MQLLCTPTSMVREQVKDRQPIYDFAGFVVGWGHLHDSFPPHSTFLSSVFTPTPVTILENITLLFDSRTIHSQDYTQLSQCMPRTFNAHVGAGCAPKP